MYNISTMMEIISEQIIKEIKTGLGKDRKRRKAKLSAG